MSLLIRKQQTHLVIQQYRHRTHGNRQIKTIFSVETRVLEARRVLLVAGIEGQARKTAKLAAIEMPSKIGCTAARLCMDGYESKGFHMEYTIFFGGGG